MNSDRSNYLSLKYQSYTLSESDVGIRKFKFVARAQFLWRDKNTFSNSLGPLICTGQGTLPICNPPPCLAIYIPDCLSLSGVVGGGGGGEELTLHSFLYIAWVK